jgi:ABC-2 type transport system permease protein
MGGYGVIAPPTSALRTVVAGRYAGIPTVAALALAGFRRYSTYRQATLASATANSVFGFLRCFVLLAVAAASPTTLVAGYDRGQLALYCWVSQGLLGVVGLWGWTELGDRIRTGDVVGDLLRPIHPVLSYLGTDLGRAAHASLTRFVVPVACGAVFFTLHLPARWSTYPLFLLSTLLAVVVCFGGRYLVNAAGFWLLDVRGVTMAWTFGTAVLAGLAFPLHFLPAWLRTAIWVGTPFPSMLQAPLDVIVERGSTGSLLGVVAGQAAWAVALLWLCWFVQRRAVVKLVIQGG